MNGPARLRFCILIGVGCIITLAACSGSPTETATRAGVVRDDVADQPGTGATATADTSGRTGVLIGSGH